MKAGGVESKFKFMLGKCPSFTSPLGEPFKERFEGITLSDAASESNFIRSNGVFTAVLFHNGLLIWHNNIDTVEVRWRRCHRCYESLQLQETGS